MASDPTAVQGTLYRAVWRWHFYAGLLVLPFLAWLAVTGGLYLYKPEIERALYADWIRVAPAPAIALDTMIGRAERDSGGEVRQVIRPAADGESWRMTIALPGGERRTAFVDPANGDTLGMTAQGGIMQTVRELHSLAITGPIGNALIEIVAGWAIVLVLSGLYLWWPRGATPALGLRGRPRGRVFWRDLHASTGILAGVVILFLAVTGMPWSGIWGEAAQSYVATHELGRPKAPAPGKVSQHREHGDHDAARILPWSMQRAMAPHGGIDRIGPGQALAIAEGRGINAPWTLNLPAAPDAPYLVSAGIVRAQDAHLVYIDAGTGHVLQEAAYREFGAGAQVIEWGIATHQGQQYGEPNRLLMLAGCLAVMLLVVSAPIMWWKRRPKGRLGAPPGRSGHGLLAIMGVAGLMFPLTGLTMAVAMLGDRLILMLRGRSGAAS